MSVSEKKVFLASRSRLPVVASQRQQPATNARPNVCSMQSEG